MDTFGRICLWVILGIIISVVSWLLDVPMTFNDMKFLLPICATLFSFNFAACSSCSNALLKYKEIHKDKTIGPVVQEMKESIVAMAVGMLVVLLSLFALYFFENSNNFGMNLGRIFANGLIYGAFVMYVWLIYDIAVTFFDLIKNKQ